MVVHVKNHRIEISEIFVNEVEKNGRIQPAGTGNAERRMNMIPGKNIAKAGLDIQLENPF